MAHKVIGSYKCGCTYGPISRRGRLQYCAVHGENIQREYVVIDFKKKKKKKSNA